MKLSDILFGIMMGTIFGLALSCHIGLQGGLICGILIGICFWYLGRTETPVQKKEHSSMQHTAEQF